MWHAIVTTTCGAQYVYQFTDLPHDASEIKRGKAVGLAHAETVKERGAEFMIPPVEYEWRPGVSN